LFRKECWEWPEDLGDLVIKKDEIYNFEFLCLISGKNRNFATE